MSDEKKSVSVEDLSPEDRAKFETLMMEEDLCPELARYREKMKPGGYPAIRHPFVHGIYPETGYMNHTANAIFKDKSEGMVEAMKENDIQSALILIERPYRCNYAYNFFIENWRLVRRDSLPAEVYSEEDDWLEEFVWIDATAEQLVKPEKAAPIIAWIWTDTENFFENKWHWHELLKFIQNNHKEFMGDEDWKFFQDLPDEFTIYRGYDADYETDEDFGFSWSLSQEQAQWFADRFGSESGAVATKKVKKSEVVGYLSSRKEEEIVYVDY